MLSSSKIQRKSTLEVPPDATIVSRKTLFGSFDGNEDDEINKDADMEDARKRFFERLEREVEVSCINDTIYQFALSVDERNENINSEEEKDENQQVFRLFAHAPPTTISLESKDINDYNDYVQYARKNIEKSRDQRDESKRLEQIHSSVITTEQILKESKIPWERNFVLHKVIHVPKRKREIKVKKSKRRKSKKRRDAERNEGLVKKSHSPHIMKGNRGYAYGRNQNEPRRFSSFKKHFNYGHRNSNINYGEQRREETKEWRAR
ncbi:7045_t:CDS:2 [Acaulospora morrowiae]|uniref:7045_t:CDS:1 n=1 Tax=Acaulospora morrowiae TaxID=94023 RepID=A0A9N8VS29_9GLOM|nr:7045_t:CDS:2 [Acaulospora morrowiae]